ncbi:MAG: hypothetical protein WBA51_05125 [Erythrobacter sp.]
MTTRWKFAALGAFSLALAGCDSADTSADDGGAPSVEMPADEALEPITDEPVADEGIGDIADVQGPPAVSQETASRAAENAQNVAAQAEAAAAAAEAADAAAMADIAADALDAAEDLPEETGDQ